MKGKIYTKWFLLTALAVSIIYDIIINVTYGADATISRFIWHLQFDYPPIGQAILFGLGFLMGHLFWAQKPKLTTRDDYWEGVK